MCVSWLSLCYRIFDARNCVLNRACVCVSVCSRFVSITCRVSRDPLYCSANTRTHAHKSSKCTTVARTVALAQECVGRSLYTHAHTPLTATPEGGRRRTVAGDDGGNMCLWRCFILSRCLLDLAGIRGCGRRTFKLGGRRISLYISVAAVAR